MLKSKFRKNSKVKIFLPAMLALAVFVSYFLTTNVAAQDTSNYPSIVQKIAQRFNLNVSDVEEVFDEDRDEKRAEMFARFADRLDDLVSEGKLTEVQKEAILDKHEEMQDAMESLVNLSTEDKKEKMRQLHEDFKNWAEQEGIELPFMGSATKGYVRGFHKGYMMSN